MKGLEYKLPAKYYPTGLPGIKIISMPNGGGQDTTDWTNPTSGLAQYWLSSGTGTGTTHSIVTGSGFSGNAQQTTSGGANGGIRSYNIVLSTSKKYSVIISVST